VSISSSLVLLALGAILAFAVEYEPSHVDLQAVGVILMLTAALALALCLRVESSRWGVWSEMRRRTSRP